MICCTRVALAMAAGSLTAAGGDVKAVSFDVYDNVDNVHFRQRSPGVSDLGIADGVMACQNSCTSRLATDPGPHFLLRNPGKRFVGDYLNFLVLFCGVPIKSRDVPRDALRSHSITKRLQRCP